MKRNSFKLILLAVMLITLSTSVPAQIYVQIQPAVPVVVRPAQPGPQYIWINEDWQPHGNKYKYTGGYWAVPPQQGSVYRKGYWVRTSKGQKWVKGGWHKKQYGKKEYKYGKKDYKKVKHHGKHKGKHKHKH